VAAGGVGLGTLGAAGLAGGATTGGCGASGGAAGSGDSGTWLGAALSGVVASSDTSLVPSSASTPGTL
jgi:hypothetical protein